MLSNTFLKVPRKVFSIQQFKENLRQLFSFSNYIEEIDHFTLDLLKSFLLWTIHHNEREFKL